MQSQAAGGAILFGGSADHDQAKQWLAATGALDFVGDVTQTSPYQLQAAAGTIEINDPRIEIDFVFDLSSESLVLAASSHDLFLSAAGETLDLVAEGVSVRLDSYSVHDLEDLCSL